jgi:23S rRNA-intervening sequence protein
MKIREHTDLEVYRKAFDAAMLIFELSKKFPKEETYSLTDQIRRSSRSVCTNLAEVWRKRRYLERDQSVPLYKSYDEILRMLVAMINKPQSWVITR